jgi:hypothetical protein
VRAGEDAESHRNRRESADFDTEGRRYIEDKEDRHEQWKPTHDVDIAAEQSTEPNRAVEQTETTEYADNRSDDDDENGNLQCDGNALPEKRKLLDHFLQWRTSLTPSNECASPGNGAERR